MALELTGARLRIERERELVWWGAMLPWMEKPIPLELFVGRPVDERERVERFHAAWDRLDRSLRH